MLFTSENFVISDLTYKWWGTGGEFSAPCSSQYLRPCFKTYRVSKIVNFVINRMFANFFKVLYKSLQYT